MNTRSRIWRVFPAGPGIKHLYPRWDDEQDTVVSLPYAINLCRKQHNLSALDYMGEAMNSFGCVYGVPKPRQYH